jgi:uncharacterized SAM-binding protein YcdF (DUF218 family)
MPPAPPAPLVLADPRRVGLVAGELVRNRLAARPDATLLLPPDGLTGTRTTPGLDPDAIDLAVLELERDGMLVPEPPRQIAGAREIVVLARGAPAAGALHAMLEAPPVSPAAQLRDHPRITVIADAAAASGLRPRPGFASDTLLVVLGHREPGISAEHRISAESHARVRHALRLARRSPVRAAILTGYTSTGGLSEAEQMKMDWDESVAPALLEVAGRDTAENATRSLPILLALGEARHVLVVSSAWHVRVPFFFAPYRRFGLRVGYRVSFAHGNWPRMLAEEARHFARAPARRREALAAMRLPPALEGRGDEHRHDPRP